MKKAAFSKLAIALIASKVREFKKLHVSTEGQMFTVEEDAMEAVRTKNMVLDEPDDYIGLVTLTEDMVSDERIRAYAKDTTVFDALFEGAKIPRVGKKVETFERKMEKPTESSQDADLLKAMGLGSDAEIEAERLEEEKLEAAKRAADAIAAKNAPVGPVTPPVAPAENVEKVKTPAEIAVEKAKAASAKK